MNREKLKLIIKNKYIVPNEDGEISDSDKMFINDIADIAEQYAKKLEGSKWVSVETPPKEGGRYWCYIEEINDLGISYYQWNCSYNETMKVWGNCDNNKVLLWTNLLPTPPQKQ